MNAPLNLLAPPKAGAIYLQAGIPGFAAPGSWIDIDQAGGGVINLSTGQRLALNHGRQDPRFFAGAPPAPTDVHVAIPIAGYISGYKQPARFLLDELVQTQPVDFQTFNYWTQSAATTFLRHNTKASQLSSVTQVQIDPANVSARTADRRVGVFVPYRTEQQSDFPFFQASARKAWNAIMLDREYDAFASGGLFMTSGTWNSAVRTALGGTDNWGPPGSEGSTSNPPRDLRAARLKSSAPIDFWAMSLKQSDWFLQHPATIDHYKAFGRDGVTAGIIRDVVQEQMNSTNAQHIARFNIPMIGTCLVHNAWATTDPAVAAAPFWPDDIVLGFSQSPTMPPNGDICTAINFRLKNPVDGSTGTPPPGAAQGVPTNNGWRVRMVPLPLIGSGGQLMIIDLSEVTTAVGADSLADVGAYISGIS